MPEAAQWAYIRHRSERCSACSVPEIDPTVRSLKLGFSGYGSA